MLSEDRSKPPWPGCPKRKLRTGSVIEVSTSEDGSEARYLRMWPMPVLACVICGGVKKPTFSGIPARNAGPAVLMDSMSSPRRLWAAPDSGEARVGGGVRVVAGVERQGVGPQQRGNPPVVGDDLDLGADDGAGLLVDLLVDGRVGQVLTPKLGGGDRARQPVVLTHEQRVQA